MASAMAQPELQSGTAMEAALARGAHSEALQAERQRQLEEFRRSCQRRVSQRSSARAKAQDDSGSVEQVLQLEVQFLDPSCRAWVQSSSPNLPTLRDFALDSRREAMRRLARLGSHSTKEKLEELVEEPAVEAPAVAEEVVASPPGWEKVAASIGTKTQASQDGEKFVQVVGEALFCEIAGDAADMDSGLPEVLPESLKKTVSPDAAGLDEVAETKAAESSTRKRSEGDRPSRYTSGLMSLMVRAYAKRGRPPPRLCACVALPQGPAPSVGSDGNLSQTQDWEAFIQKVAAPDRHARNCEFAEGGLSRLQRQVLLLIQGAKDN